MKSAVTRRSANCTARLRTDGRGELRISVAAVASSSRIDRRAGHALLLLALHGSGKRAWILSYQWFLLARSNFVFCLWLGPIFMALCDQLSSRRLISV